MSLIALRTRADISRIELKTPVLGRRRLKGKFFLRKNPGGRYVLVVIQGKIQEEVEIVDEIRLPAELSNKKKVDVKYVEAIRFPDLHRQNLIALDITVEVKD